MSTQPSRLKRDGFFAQDRSSQFECEGFFADHTDTLNLEFAMHKSIFS